MPLFSQGFRVCLSPPCTDEPRLRLEPEDIIKVTRFRKHWLFGERVVDAATELQKEGGGEAIKKKPLRGWFPRRCAIELIQPSQPITSEDEDCNEPERSNNGKLDKSKKIANGNISRRKATHQQNGHKKSN